MPEPQKPIPQEKSKPISNDMEECYVILNQALARVETAKVMHYYSDDWFQVFYEYFKRLWTTTRHEELLKTKMYGKISLLAAVQHYFSGDVKTNWEFGARVARVYVDALFETGILTAR